MRARARWATLLLAAALVHTPPSAEAHPLHTSITDLTLDPSTRRVQAVIRIFANDFDAAVAGAARGPTDVRARAAYLSRNFILYGGDGKQIQLHWRSTRLTDDLLWIYLEGSAPAGLRGGRLHNTIATDLYSDQVNIVKSRYGERERTLLFTRGTLPQRLP